MRFCKKCVMPDTRPGITFNEEGVCIACQHNERKKEIDWDARFEELKKLCDKYRRKNKMDYDCIIAVSGGKDSHYQVHVMKDLLDMNPLLITVEDVFTPTEAGVHNLKNINEEFGCSMISYKPNRRAAKIISRYMFEKYGRPLWYVDRLVYTVPLYFASIFNIPFLIHGENVSYEYGGVDDEETYSAKDLVLNGVVPDFDFKEFLDLGVKEEELAYLEAPSIDVLNKIEPIYLSYFIEWNSIKNYEFAKRHGFKDLEHEWDRTSNIECFNQIDSIGYMLNGWMKYPKYGHGWASDYASRWVRYGVIDRDKAVELVEERDHALDSKTRDDFCNFVGMSVSEFYDALDKLYNKEIFEQNELGQWRLKKENYEKRRNP